MFESADEAIERLKVLIQPDDLVLIKGSRAVGMDRIVTEISNPTQTGQE